MSKGSFWLQVWLFVLLISACAIGLSIYQMAEHDTAEKVRELCDHEVSSREQIKAHAEHTVDSAISVQECEKLVERSFSVWVMILITSVGLLIVACASIDTAYRFGRWL